MEPKKVLLMVVLFILLILGMAYEKSHRKFSYHSLTTEGAIEMMKKEEVIILDVRTKLEFDAGHIKGAINVPLESIDDKFSELFQDKNAYYMVYCRSGNRSETASKKLATYGYRNVYDFGSIENYKEPLVKD